MNPTREDDVTMEDNYALPRNSMERGRLELQHRVLTETAGGRLIFDSTVKLEPGSRVLDSGTGAASWMLDLQKRLPEAVELVGVDISRIMFPDNIPSNVKFHEISSLALPDNWENTFDLINQRLLMSSLTPAQWRADLHELYRVLKPGGAIQLTEYGTYGSPTNSTYSLPATKTAIGYLSAVYERFDILGLNCGIQVPGMLREVGFSCVRVEVLQQPLGRQWGELGEMGTQNWLHVVRHFGNTCLAEGGLGTCGSQAEIDEIIGQTEKEWNENSGIFANVYIITARKPLFTHCP